jgi:Fe-S cluster assembly iron-binding protein IscA
VNDYRAKHTATEPRLATLTEAAARHVNRYLSRRGKGIGVRLGVKTTGCSAWPTSWSMWTRCSPMTWSSKTTASRC